MNRALKAGIITLALWTIAYTMLRAGMAIAAVFGAGAVVFDIIFAPSIPLYYLSIAPGILSGQGLNSPGAFIGGVTPMGLILSAFVWTAIGSGVGAALSALRPASKNTATIFTKWTTSICVIALCFLVISVTSPFFLQWKNGKEKAIIGEIRSGTPDIDVAKRRCQAMGDGNFKRSECFAALAETTGDTNFCKEAPYAGFDCYGKAGRTMGDVSACALLDHPTAVIFCMRGAVESLRSSDERICDNLSDFALSQCLYQTALQQSDPARCLDERIQQHDRDQCLLKKVPPTGSPDLCEEIEYSVTRKFCINAAKANNVNTPGV